MKRKHDLAYRLRLKRAQANLTFRAVSAVLGGSLSVWMLHRIETRKQQPTPAQEAILSAFLRMSPAAVAAKARAMEGRR